MVVHLGRQALVVEIVDHAILDQQVAAAPLRLERLDLGEQRAVVRPEFLPALVIALDQRALDEEAPRLHRVDAPEVHAALVREHQPEQAYALAGHHLARARRPVRRMVLALDQVFGPGQHPFGLDRGHAARVEPRGFDQLRRHHPLRRLAEHEGARMQVEAPPAHALVVALLGARADVRQHAREHRAVQRLLAGRLVVLVQAQFAADQAQLVVDVAPFAQPHERQELALAQPSPRARRQRLALFLDIGPQLQHRDEVRGGAGKAAMALVGGLLLLDGALARILHAEETRDHQHLGQRTEPGRRQQHAPDARIHRQARQLPADRGQSLALERAELLEQADAVVDLALLGRVEERETSRPRPAPARASAGSPRRARCAGSPGP